MEEGVKKSKIKRSFSTPLQSLPAFEAEDKEVAKQLEMCFGFRKLLEGSLMNKILLFWSNFLIHLLQAELTTVPEDEDLSLPPPLMASPIKPFLKPSHTIEALEEESENATESENDNNHNVSKESNNSVTLIPFDSQNPWDLVPDQPANRSSNSLVIPVPPPSSTTTTENGSNINNANLLSNNTIDDTMMNNKMIKQSNNIKIEELSKSSSQNLMDDPFDADWVSLALNETTGNNHQPL